jgi:predicted nucleic acid-binding protein
MEVGLGRGPRTRKFDGFDPRRPPWDAMIPCYFDTGLVLKLVVKEPLSKSVLDFVSSRMLVVPYTGFVELECANAIAAKVYRGEFDPSQSSAALDLIGDFVRQSLFVRIPLDMSAVVRDTVELVARSTSSTGCRTLDLIHIASALALGAKVFATGDSRQAKAARVCGLEVVEIRLESNRSGPSGV